MAKAKFIQQKPDVQLTLTHEEAEVIHAITRRISGHPDTTRRGLTDGIGKALREIGISHNDSDIVTGLSFGEK